MMLNFFNKYPYTDFHELNLDWLLDRMRKLEDELNDALETLSTEIYNQVMTDMQPTLNQLRNDINALTNDFNSLRGQFEDLDNAFDDFEVYINGKLEDLKNYTDASIDYVNSLTDAKILDNNTYLLSEMTTYLNQIEILNFFTGELVSIQYMFDYLASLHATDALDYDTMALRAKTYTELAAFGKTYTELVMSGNTWYV